MFTTSKVNLLLQIIALASIANNALAESPFTCTVGNDNNNYVLEALDGTAVNDKFPCNKVENTEPLKTAKEVIVDRVISDTATEETCDLEQKDKITYYLKEVSVPSYQPWTGLWCHYQCTPSHLRCLQKPLPADTQCACSMTGLQASIVPFEIASSNKFSGFKNELANVASFGGVTVQSASSGSSEEANRCTGKDLGDAVDDDFNCISIEVTDPEKDVLFPADTSRNSYLSGMCEYKKREETSYTRYIKAPYGTKNGEVCGYVCKYSTNYECKNSLFTNGMCSCEEKRVLRPKIINVSEKQQAQTFVNALEQGGSSRMLQRTDADGVPDAEAPCAEGSGSCGVCGTCVEGTCVLKESNPEMSNFCPCGKMCPSLREVKSRQTSLGAPINCVRNRLMTGLRCTVSPGKGDTIPDLCAESSESDLMDMCVCAATHKEQLPVYKQSGVEASCVPL